MAKRSNLLVVVGLAVCIFGGALVLLLLRSNGHKSHTSAVVTGQTVVVATKAIDPGTTGTDAIAAGEVAIRSVTPGTKATDAVGTLDELTGYVITSAVKPGAQLQQSMLKSQTLRRAAIKIPDGKQAVAVQLDFVPGVAGYVGAGDQVNIYANMRVPAQIPNGASNAAAAAASSPAATTFTKLMLSNVEVLDVNTEVAPRVANPQADTARATGSPIVFLLALDANEAEKLIYATTNDSLYATLVPKGQPPASTGGRAAGNLFQ